MQVCTWVMIVAWSALCMGVVSQACADSARESAADDSATQLSIPLRDGCICVGELLNQLNDSLGLPLDLPEDALQWTIDVHSIAGRLQLKALEQFSEGVLSCSVNRDALRVVIDRDLLKSRLQRVGDAAVAKIFETEDDLHASDLQFGLRLLPAEGATQQIAGGSEFPAHAVVLVHGLDDPGVMWDNLVPELDHAGFRIARFDYPNDGPISEATDFLAAELRKAHAQGLQRIDVVAHSMGGLVVRDLLTRSSYYGGDGSGGRDLPAVDRFIMVGTPNYGSSMARLRTVSEVREQLHRLLSGRKLSGLRDGRGEAAVDLEPQSDFLRRLNARPLPQHTKITIIAARFIPMDEQRAEQWLQRLHGFAAGEDSPQWLRDLLNESDPTAAAAKLNSLIDTVGDVCVPVESARLEGVEDFVIVEGQHVGVLVNMYTPGQTTPPAIPIIMNRLGPVDNQPPAE